MSRQISIWVVAAVVLVAGYFQWQNQSDVTETSPYEVRAALDIGSGATKLKVAQVDIKSNKIVKIIFQKTVAIPFKDQLDHSTDKEFSAKIMEQGIAGFKELKADAVAAGAQKVVGIATAAFREANNAPEYVRMIKAQTGIEVLILTQDQEGKIAFRGAVALCDEACFETAVVWDIGGGSYQFTTENEKEELIVSKGAFASVGFKNYIIGTVQGKKLTETLTPNPISLEEAQKAEEYAKEYASKIDPYIKEKIRDKSNYIIGVGGVFVYGVKPYLEENKKSSHIVKLSRVELNKIMKGFLNLDDAAVLQKAQALIAANAANPPVIVEIAQSNIQATVSNLIYVEGFMEGLGVEPVYIMQVNNADGAMTTPELWK